jgi:hypothetical protein
MISTILLLALVLPLAPQEQAVDMTTYQMVFLTKGPNYDAVSKSADAQKLQDAHLAGLIALNEKRVNLLFGPLLDSGTCAGLSCSTCRMPTPPRRLWRTIRMSRPAPWR